jgi:copper chaperone CopZ
MARSVLNVPGISCEHCQAHITRALTAQPGVRTVHVEIPAKRVTVEYDEGAISLARLQEVLAEEDYPVASVEAS